MAVSHAQQHFTDGDVPLSRVNRIPSPNYTHSPCLHLDFPLQLKRPVLKQGKNSTDQSAEQGGEKDGAQAAEPSTQMADQRETFPAAAVASGTGALAQPVMEQSNVPSAEQPAPQQAAAAAAAEQAPGMSPW